MANVLTSFLIGIGLDTTEFQKGQKTVSSGLDSIKSKTLALGSAVLAGAFGMGKMGVDFAETADKLGKFGKTFGVAADDVAGFGRAIQENGGDFEAAMSQLEQIERWRAAYKVGDTSWFQAAGMAGVDYNAVITATDALQALLAQGDRFKASSPQMRLNMATALGIDPATLRLLSQGRDEAAQSIEKYKALRPLTEEATQSAAEFNKEFLLMKTNMGSSADDLSTKTLPILTMSLKGWNTILTEPEKVVAGASQALGKSTAGDVYRGAVGVVSPKMEQELKKKAGVKNPEQTGAWYQRGIDWIQETYGYKPEQKTAIPMPTGPAVMPSTTTSRQSSQTELLQKAQANRPTEQPPIVVHTHLNLDGREIDKRIISVSQTGNKSALDNIRSTTAR